MFTLTSQHFCHHLDFKRLDQAFFKNLFILTYPSGGSVLQHYC